MLEPDSEPRGHDAARRDITSRKTNNPRIFQYADRFDRALDVAAIVCTIGSGVAMPLMSLLFGKLTSEYSNFSNGSVDPEKLSKSVRTTVVWFIYLFVAKLVLTYLATTAITISSIRTTRALRVHCFECLLRTEVWYFDTPGVGSPATQITTSAARISQGIAVRLLNVTQGLTVFCASFVVSMIVQWKLTLITMMVIPASFVITGICVSFDAPIEAAMAQAYSQAAALAREALSSIGTVHAFSAQRIMVSRYNTHLTEAHRQGRKKFIIYGFLVSPTYLCVYSGIALAFWQGHRMYDRGEIRDVSSIMTIVLCVTLASSSMGLVFPQLSSITAATAAASELFRLIDKPSEIDPVLDEGHRPSSCAGNIGLNSVTFAYPSRPDIPVIDSLSVDIPAGKTVAIVGPSGSGKSTIVGLLERWFDPSAGCITLDGFDVTTLNIKWLRQQIGLVQQEPTLFSGTVFDNVAMGLTDAQRACSDQEQRRLVQQACEASDIHSFVQQLPQGYDTWIGEHGHSISGGQKQRIAIARCIISNPAILLLDEPTSALDPEAECTIQKVLDRISRGCTTIVIAHRLSTIRNADHILVISGGRATEQGTHEDLLAKGGYYASLVKAQSLSSTVQTPRDTIASPRSSGLSKSLARFLIEKPDSDAMENINGSDALSNPMQRSLSLVTCLAMILREQRSLYPVMALILVASFLAAGSWPAQGILFSRLIHWFMDASPQGASSVNFYSLMFFFVAIGNFVAYFAIGCLSNVLSQRITHQYRLELFERLIYMDIAFFSRPEHSSGSLASTLSTIPDRLQELLSLNIVILLIMVVSTVASSCLALAYGWKLALVMIFAGLPLLLGSGFVRVRVETALDDENERRFAQASGLASEAVTSLRTIASLTCEAQTLAKYTDIVDGAVRDSIKPLALAAVPYALSQSIEFLIMALGFWYGSHLMQVGEYTAEQFFIIFIAVLFAGQAASEFFAASGSLSRAKGAAQYLVHLRGQSLHNNGMPSHPNKHPAPDGPLSVADVHFSYPERSTPVLRGVSLKVCTLQTPQALVLITLAGASGCGKSSLLALLERFFEPTSGEIRLGEDNIQHLSLERYRMHVSLVQQEPVLYPGTIRDNIILGLDPEPSTEEIYEAMKQAHILDFVLSLPQGLETDCGSRGIALSGGQRQRIAIARSLIRNPRILLLDEATSALDTQSERFVQAAIDEVCRRKGQLVVAVAHRLSTIRNADCIFVLSNGQVIGFGTHDQLRRENALYNHMCLAQSLDEE
ncbi:hypothetical protein CDV55_102878 [Aspergillus turcosus]|nr:hypothetical protein CDV55_102878 [Aspergillus turcosus]